MMQQLAPLLPRLLSILTGYFCGCILTAEIVAKRYTGKSASEIGTSHNPGMANIMAHVGMKPGLLTLAGDLLKCILAAMIVWLLFGYQNVLPGAAPLSSLAILWAGFGCTLGHNYPFWKKFRGGKGVATTCAAVTLFSPLIGIPSMLIGMIAVFITSLLSLGGVIIPLAFTGISAAIGLSGNTGMMEAALIGLLLTLLAISRNYSQLRLIPKGEAEKVPVFGGLMKKLHIGTKK